MTCVRLKRNMSLIQTKHVTYSNESCHFVWTSHVTRMNESCHTYACVLSHTCRSHVTRMNASRRTVEWIISHTRTSHVTHKHQPRHIAHVTEACHTSEARLCHVYARYDCVSYDWYKSYCNTYHVAIQIMLCKLPRHVTRVKHICVTYMRDMTMCHMTDTNHVAQWYKLYHAYDLCIWLSYCA